jgi:hypothetical protein
MNGAASTHSTDRRPARIMAIVFVPNETLSALMGKYGPGNSRRLVRKSHSDGAFILAICNHLMSRWTPA